MVGVSISKSWFTVIKVVKFMMVQSRLKKVDYNTPADNTPTTGLTQIQRAEDFLTTSFPKPQSQPPTEK
jgi:hypothetical protein